MSRKSSQKRIRSLGRYRPTGIPGLMLHPTALLLNLVVYTAEDNAKTDGLIPLETVNRVTALIRHAYDFPDVDRSQGKGMVISFIGQFFHPDDYLEHRIADAHAQGVLSALQGDLQPQMLKAPDLRTSNVPDPMALAQGREKALPLYYKQRFLSFCFAGESAELDKLQGDAPAELLIQVLGTIRQGLDISEETFFIVHPAFVPARRVRKVSVQNALQWAEQMKQLMEEFAEQGTEAELAVIGPPGPSYTVRAKSKRPRRKKQ